jgi:hypothetical protein
MTTSRYFPSVCLKGLTQSTTNLSQNSRSSGRNLNQMQLYSVTSRPPCLVSRFVIDDDGGDVQFR